MRIVDVLLAFPAVVMLLLIAGGVGQSVGALILAVALVQAPAVARVTRTATADAATRGYVDAAFARGERLSSVLGREILPNVSPIILADFGLRFGWSIVLIASMNYLSLGLHAPASDWGLMMAENRLFIGTNPLSVAAPAILLGLLTIAVNLLSDAFARTSVSRAAARRGLVHA
jgi:ABC-type dipeptide/oligopeptide/nickel transport system permease subunit